MWLATLHVATWSAWSDRNVISGKKTRQAIQCPYGRALFCTTDMTNDLSTRMAWERTVGGSCDGTLVGFCGPISRVFCPVPNDCALPGSHPPKSSIDFHLVNSRPPRESRRY